MPSVLDTFLLEVGLDTSKANTGLAKLVEGVRKGSADVVKVGSQFEQQGNQIAGFFSKINSLYVTVSKGMKEFVSRIGEASPAVQGLGKSVSGTAKEYSAVLKELTTAFEQLPSVSNAQFKALGIALLDNEGVLRSTADIMKELNVEFSKMDPTKAEAIGKAMGFSPATMALLLKAPDQYHKIFQEQERVNKAEQEQSKLRKEAAEQFEVIRNKVLELYAVFTAGRGIKEFVTDITRSDAAMGYLAKKLDMAPSELSAWGGAMRGLGGTAEDVESVFQAIRSDFEQLSLTGNSQFLPFFRALGIATADAQGQLRPMTDLMHDLNAAFSNMDPARAAAWGAQMGITPKMMDLLLKAPDQFEKILAEQEKLHHASDRDIAAAQARQRAWDNLMTAADNLGRIVLTELSPALNKVLELLTGITEWANSHPVIVEAAFVAVTATVGVLSSAISVRLVGGALAGLLKMFGLVRVAGSTSLLPAIASVASLRRGLGLVALILSSLTGTQIPLLSDNLFVVGTAATAWGPLVKIVGLLASGLSGLLVRLGVLTATALPGLADAFIAIGAAIEATPIGWLITILGGLGLAIYEVYKHWNDLKEAFKGTFSSVLSFSKTALSVLTGVVPPAEAHSTEPVHKPVAATPRTKAPETAPVPKAKPETVAPETVPVPRPRPGVSKATGGYRAAPVKTAISKSDIDTLMGFGWTRNQAIGILANLQRESGGQKTPDYKTSGDSGLAYGLAQWHPDRQADFAKWAGHDIRQSTREEQLAFVNYELREGSRKRAGKALMDTSDAENAAKIVSRLYEGPRHADLEAATRAQIAAAMATMPDSAFALAGGGARLAAAASQDQKAAAGNTYDQRRTITSENHVGQVIVNTQATDADGIVRDIKPALQRQSFVAAIDNGPS